MSGTSLDMTAPRPLGGSPVYAVFGAPDPGALSLAAMIDARTTLVEVPFDVLVALETGRDAHLPDALARVHELCEMDYVGAVGFDDWWTTALEALNPGFPLSKPRHLVTDKAALYWELRAAGVSIADFQVGALTRSFLVDALTYLGPRPVLKPATGAGSRGVYRYRDDLTIEDNLALYQQLLKLGHIDSQVRIIVAEYLGGDGALEVSADVIVCEGRAMRTVVHEKMSATDVHPFVDHVMVCPPTHAAIVGALPGLADVLARIISTLAMDDGTLHVELRWHKDRWHVLDVGVRPGAGLIAHSMLAHTGIDPRRAHLGACLGQPLSVAAVTATAARHAATCIACCYVTHDSRPAVTLRRYSTLAADLRADPAVFDWHLNIAETDDQVLHPDAGLSIGLGAPDVPTALRRLRSLTEPYAFSTH